MLKTLKLGIQLMSIEGYFSNRCFEQILVLILEPVARGTFCVASFLLNVG
jgi:hypothetical protein